MYSFVPLLIALLALVSLFFGARRRLMVPVAVGMVGWVVAAVAVSLSSEPTYDVLRITKRETGPGLYVQDGYCPVLDVTWLVTPWLGRVIGPDEEVLVTVHPHQCLGLDFSWLPNAQAKVRKRCTSSSSCR